MKRKYTLSRAILSSSIFLTTFGFSSASFAVFTPVVDGSNSTATPSAGGYDFAAGTDATFNITDTNAITNTAGVSFDRTGAGVATLNFLGSSVVSGGIGDYTNSRPIHVVNLNTANHANAIIEVQTGNVMAGALNFTNDATLKLDAANQIVQSNMSTSNLNTGIIQFVEGGTLIGSIGATNALKKLDFINQSGGNTLTINNGSTFNNVSIGGDGILQLNSTFTVTQQVNFTGDGLLQFADGVNGNATNGVIAQNNQQGNVTFLGESTFSGDLGDSAHILNSIIAGANSTEVQLRAGHIYAKNITLSGDGIVNFVAAVAPTDIYAPINPSVNNTGEIKTSATNTVTFKQASGQVNAIRLFTVAGNAVIDADFLATQTNINAAKTLTINAGKKLQSNIDGGVATQGNLVFNDTNSSYGTIGATSSLAQVTFTGAAGSVFTLKHDIQANQTNINNQETLLIDNAVNHHITGNLFLNNSAQLTVPFGKTLTMSGLGNVTFSANTQLNYNMANGVTGVASALISTAGTVSLNTASILNLVAAPKISTVPIGQVTVNIIQDNSGAILGLPILIGANNNLFLTTQLSTKPGELNLNLNRIAMASLTVQPHLIGVSTVFDEIVGRANVTGELLMLTNQLDAFTDLATFRKELTSIIPLIDTANNQTVQTIQQDVFGLFNQRIDALRAENNINQEQGYNAGFLNHKNQGAWVKFFSNHARQDARDLLNGFHSKTMGFGLGGDTFLTERCVLGAGLAYANAEIYHDLNEAKTEINYYQASLYGGINFKNPWFMNWMAAATYLDYDQHRTLGLAAAKIPVQANYDGWQYGIRAEMGYAFGKLSFHTIPILALSYRYLDIAPYTETGAGTANQQVSYKAHDDLQAEFGVKLVNDSVFYHTLTQPEIHAKVRYDLFNEKQKLSSQFVSIGPVYHAIGYQPTKESYNAGASLTLFGEAGFNLSVSYDYDFRNDFCAHTGFVRLRYEW